MRAQRIVVAPAVVGEDAVVVDELPLSVEAGCDVVAAEFLEIKIVDCILAEHTRRHIGALARGLRCPPRDHLRVRQCLVHRIDVERDPLRGVGRHHFRDRAGCRLIRIMVVVAVSEVAALAKQLASTPHTIGIYSAGMTGRRGPIHVVVLDVNIRPVRVRDPEVPRRKAESRSGDERRVDLSIGESQSDVSWNVHRPGGNHWPDRQTPVNRVTECGSAHLPRTINGHDDARCCDGTISIGPTSEEHPGAAPTLDNSGEVSVGEAEIRQPIVVEINSICDFPGII